MAFEVHLGESPHLLKITDGFNDETGIYSYHECPHIFILAFIFKHLL